MLSLLIMLALGASAADSGYVVKIESGSVYIDLGEKAGAAQGQPFHVYTEGDELKHPVSGQSLGRVERSVGEGRVTLVLPLYSVGSMLHGAGEVKSGMRAKLGPAPAQKEQPAPQPALAGKQPRLKSRPFEYQISGMAVADFRGDGKPALAIAGGKQVDLYSYPPGEGQPSAQFVIPGAAIKVLSLSAGDVNGDGRAELFVTVHNEGFERAETIVLELVDGAWKRTADLPWLVRAHQDGSGAQVLAMQQLLQDQTFPYSTIYKVAYKDGKYTTGEAVRHKRVEFLYDFTQAKLDGGKEPAVLYLTSNDSLRVQFKSGYWRSPSAYGQTPTRLRWHGRLLEFHPQLPVEGNSVFVVKNTAALGGLSAPFGVFNGGSVERLAWNGLALEPRWTAELGGYATALQLVGDDLAVAVNGTAGQSSIWIFDKQ